MSRSKRAANSAMYTGRAEAVTQNISYSSIKITKREEWVLWQAEKSEAQSQETGLKDDSGPSLHNMATSLKKAHIYLLPKMRFLMQIFQN